MKRPFCVTLVIVISTAITSFSQNQALDLKSSIVRGKEVYIAQCMSCHMDEGQGLEDVYPPLAKSDYLMANKKRSIQQILYGVREEIKVKGKIYSLEMTGIELTDREASDVLNYIRNSWGNKGVAVTPEEVKQARKKQ